MNGLSMRHTTRVAAVGMVVASATLSAQPRASQTANLVGMVKDSVGTPISGAEVWIRSTDLFAHTDEKGGFRLANTPVGSVKVTLRRIGFEQATVDLELRAGRTDSLVISLTSVATNLPGVVVEEESRSKKILAGFWDRRSKGFGHFLTRDEIDAKHAQDFTDLVRATPGITIATMGGRRQVRFSRSTMSPRGDCPPQYWLDGMRVESASADEFPPGDIEAIELYAGSATIPSQFAPRAVQVQKTCGAIVIWTRIPGT